MTRDQRIEAMVAMLLLGIQPQPKFDPEAVESAFRRLSRTVHPDVCHGPEAARLFRMATDAREVLMRLRPVSRPAAPTAGVVWRYAPSTWHDSSYTGSTAGW